MRLILKWLLYNFLNLLPKKNFFKKTLRWSHSLTRRPYSFSEAVLGDYSYISFNSNISYCEIGKFCSIWPNFFCGFGIHPLNWISTHPMFYSIRKQNGITFSSANKVQERKKIIIGNDVFIGANVTVLDWVTIGDGAVIWAWAVVSKDIPPYAIAVGCPIMIKSYRFSPEVIEKLLRIKWWDFEEEWLKFVEKNFFDVKKFFQNYEI